MIKFGIKSYKMGKFEKGHKPLGRALNGHTTSEETKNKIRISRLGKPSAFRNKKHSEQSKIKNSLANKGKKFSDETKIKLSLSRIGCKNSNWKGGRVDLISRKIRGSSE